MKYTDLDIKGKTVISIEEGEHSADGNDAIFFECSDGTEYVLTHFQDCCEYVTIEDIDGELDTLVGSPLVMAEEAYNSEGEDDDSKTWSFYKFATVKGHVTIRFHGGSNGYYSESATLAMNELDRDLLVECPHCGEVHKLRRGDAIPISCACNLNVQYRLIEADGKCNAHVLADGSLSWPSSKVLTDEQRKAIDAAVLVAKSPEVGCRTRKNAHSLLDALFERAITNL
jgi:hypothetical protein